MIRLIIDASAPLFRSLSITSTEREIERGMAAQRRRHVRPRAAPRLASSGLRPPRRKRKRWQLLALSGAFTAHNGNLNSL